MSHKADMGTTKLRARLAHELMGSDHVESSSFD
jgi:hypothetical protein